MTDELVQKLALAGFLLLARMPLPQWAELLTEALDEGGGGEGSGC